MTRRERGSPAKLPFRASVAADCTLWIIDHCDIPESCATLGIDWDIVVAVGEKQRVRFGPFEVDLRSGELFRDDIRLKLQPQPIQVLSILLEHPGELVTRDELRKRLWPEDTFVDFEQGLNTAIKKLRQALCDEADTPHYIETLPRRGYRFVHNIVPETPQSTAAFSGAPQQPPVTSRRKRYWILAFALLVLLAAGGKVALRVISPPPISIVGTRRLTHTHLQKIMGTTYYCGIATDGNRVYFPEHRTRDEWVLSQVSTVGGEVTEVPTPLRPWNLCLSGISPSGSELLGRGPISFLFEKFWLVPLPAGPPRLATVPPGTDSVTWTPAGESYVYTQTSPCCSLNRSSTNGDNATRLFSSVNINWPHVSPDGRRVSWTRSTGEDWQRDIWEAGIDGINPHRIFPDTRQTYFGDWTADGKVFFYFRRNGTSTTLWGMRESVLPFGLARSAPSLIYAGPLELYAPVSSRNGKELYAIGADARGELSIYDARSRKFLPFLKGIPACMVTFSPDHQWVAYVSYPDGNLWKSRIDGSEKMQLTFPPMGVLSPRWSPDGRFIVFLDVYGSEFHSIYLVSSQGGQPRVLLSGPFNLEDPTWSADSRYIAYAGIWNSVHEIRVLDLNTMNSAKVSGSEGLFSPRWSPDGKFIAAMTTDARRELMIYSVDQQKWSSALEMPCGFDAWSHDSKHVYCISKGAIIKINLSTGTAEKVLEPGRCDVDRISLSQRERLVRPHS